MGAPLGKLERGSFTRDFERWMTVALEVECPSQTGLSGEGLQGGFL